MIPNPSTTSSRIFAAGSLAALLAVAACTRATPPPEPLANPPPPVRIAQPIEAEAPPAIELGEAPRLPDAEP